MHYKYVWRGLEEMFESAHLHNKRLPAMLEAFYCGDTRLLGKRFPFSTPVSCADSPCQGQAACAFGSGRWLRCFDFLAEVSLTLRHGG